MNHLTQPPFTIFDQTDRFRRLLGRMIDAFSPGVTEPPHRRVFSTPGMTLRHYGKSGGERPLLLIVPAPIKSPAIWDLTPERSVIRKCLESGAGVFLLQWAPPGAKEMHLGLNAYADRFIAGCLNAIERETGRRQVFLAGHSLGGTLCAIFTSLYPERVNGLILAGAPIHFGGNTGIFSELVRNLPQKEIAATVTGNVPGSFLNLVSFAASPGTFGWSRLLDGIGCLSNLQTLAMHHRVERWTLDELPLPRQFFLDLVEKLYRNNRFMQGTLSLNGIPARPEKITCPLLCIADARCNIVPPKAVIPFYRAVKSTEKKILWYKGDVGVSLQHVGLLMGKRSHKKIWPEVIRWIHRHGNTQHN